MSSAGGSGGGTAGAKPTGGPLARAAPARGPGGAVTQRKRPARTSSGGASQSRALQRSQPGAMVAGDSRLRPLAQVSYASIPTNRRVSKSAPRQSSSSRSCSLASWSSYTSTARSQEAPVDSPFFTSSSSPPPYWAHALALPSDECPRGRSRSGYYRLLASKRSPPLFRAFA